MVKNHCMTEGREGGREGGRVGSYTFPAIEIYNIKELFAFCHFDLQIIPVSISWTFTVRILLMHTACNFYFH
jgi:hypothetical protein